MFIGCDVVISAVDVVAEDVNRRTSETTATNMLLTVLPADIRHITDTSVFKRHLKTHFFNLYSNT